MRVFEVERYSDKVEPVLNIRSIHNKSSEFVNNCFFSQRKWYWMWSNFHDQKLIQVSDNLLLSCWLSASLQIISYPLSDVFFCSLSLLFFETDKRSCSTLKLLTAFTNILFKAVTINVPKYVQASLHRCAFSWKTCATVAMFMKKCTTVAIFMKSGVSRTEHGFGPTYGLRKM